MRLDMEDTMAKGQMRRNREQKKPKKQKVEIVPPTSVFSKPPTTIKTGQYVKREK
jgi:hypothetical protein